MLRIVGAVIDEVEEGLREALWPLTSSINRLLRSQRRRVCKLGRGYTTASIRVKRERADNLHIGSGGGGGGRTGTGVYKLEHQLLTMRALLATVRRNEFANPPPLIRSKEEQGWPKWLRRPNKGACE